MLKNVSRIAMMAGLAMPAAAQELTYGSASFDYLLLTDEDAQLSATVIQLGGTAELTYGMFLASVDVGSWKISDDPFSATFREALLSIGYMVTPEALVGGGLTYNSFDDFDDANGYEFYAQYVTEQIGASVRYIVPDTDEADFYFTQFFAEGSIAKGVTISAVVESFEFGGDTAYKTYHIAGDYDAGTVFGRSYYTTFTDAEFGFIGIDGGYRLGQGLTATAGFQTVIGDISFDYKAYRIGGSYELMPGVTADASLAVFGGEDGLEDVNQFTFGITYETGSQKRIDQRLFQAARDDMSNGFSIYSPFGQFGLFGAL